MTELPTVRIAAIQATPVILDAEASIDKAIALLHQAADDGARLAVLPETFVLLYPRTRGRGVPQGSLAGTTSGGVLAEQRRRSRSARRSPRRDLSRPEPALRDRRQRA